MTRQLATRLAWWSLLIVFLGGCAEGSPTILGVPLDATDAAAGDIGLDDARPPSDTSAGEDCTPACPSDLTCCQGQCVDPLSDPAHCGGCGLGCSPGPGGEAGICQAGFCGIECALGAGDCDGDPSNGCEADLNSADHCGQCSNRCDPGRSCVAGSCECTSAACQCGGPSAACQAGAIERDRRPCGSCGGEESRERTCLSSCQWGAWSNWSACSVSNCCGDGQCSGGEDCSSCPTDCGACGPTCGDTRCEAGEDCSSCPADCGACNTCGDGTCAGSETCQSCPDCQAGHQTTGDNNDPCPGVPAETWRCVFTSSFGTNVSQVCRGGRWVSFNLNPRNCSACVCSYSSACQQ